MKRAKKKGYFMRNLDFMFVPSDKEAIKKCLELQDKYQEDFKNTNVNVWILRENEEFETPENHTSIIVIAWGKRSNGFIIFVNYYKYMEN